MLIKTIYKKSVTKLMITMNKTDMTLKLKQYVVSHLSLNLSDKIRLNETTSSRALNAIIGPQLDKNQRSVNKQIENSAGRLLYRDVLTEALITAHVNVRMPLSLSF